jgi:hypothetical protein
MAAKNANFVSIQSFKEILALKRSISQNPDVFLSPKISFENYCYSNLIYVWVIRSYPNKLRNSYIKLIL